MARRILRYTVIGSLVLMALAALAGLIMFMWLGYLAYNGAFEPFFEPTVVDPPIQKTVPQAHQGTR